MVVMMRMTQMPPSGDNIVIGVVSEDMGIEVEDGLDYDGIFGRRES